MTFVSRRCLPPLVDDDHLTSILSRFLGGSSGCNGTLAIRGSREDFDQWEVPGWSGDEVFEYMNKVCFLVLAFSMLYPPLNSPV